MFRMAHMVYAEVLGMGIICSKNISHLLALEKKQNTHLAVWGAVVVRKSERPEYQSFALL